MPTDLLVLTPLFHGDTGGAAAYYRLLSELLRGAGLGVKVISARSREASPDHYYGLFPNWAGRDRRPIRDRLAYGLQNLSYLRLGEIVARERPGAFLVHTSFLNHPGLFPALVGPLVGRTHRGGGRAVADVRDRLLPPARVPLLNRFDAVIACSERIARHLEEHGLDARRMVRIPIPQETLRVEPAETEALRRSLGFDGAPYIFYAGLLKEGKGVDLLLRAFLEHVRPTLPECRLVLAGLLKSRRRWLREALEKPGVVYLGPRSRPEVLRLMAGAAVCASLSLSEGLPRVSLEALALGRPTLLPPGVDEFDRHCPDFVARSRDPEAVGRQLIELAQHGAVPTYPIERHSPEALLPRYREVLRV